MEKKYIHSLKSHIHAVKAAGDFPTTGVITINYDIEQGIFTSTIDGSVIATSGNGGTSGSGNPFP